MSNLDKMEGAAKRFMSAAEEALEQNHPLLRIFSGLMMVFYVDEPTLEWIDIAMRPWFSDAENVSERQEAEIVFAVMWLSRAAQLKRSAKAV